MRIVAIVLCFISGLIAGAVFAFTALLAGYSGGGPDTGLYKIISYAAIGVSTGFFAAAGILIAKQKLAGSK
jgi:hypothetical protein